MAIIPHAIITQKLINEINKQVKGGTNILADNNEPRRVILARHGQTEWNKTYRFQGKTNVQLTEEGKLQAKATLHKL